MVFLLLKNLSLKKIIHQKLVRIISFLGLNENQDIQSFNLEISERNFEENIVYKTPLCLKTSKVNQKNPSLIAEEFVNLWLKFNSQKKLNISPKVSTNGWLEFVISEDLLINWLQNLPNQTLSFEHVESNSQKPSSSIEFKIIYTHARCCSLLKSAHQDKLIQLKTFNFHWSNWLWLKPEFLPYYNDFVKLKYEKKLIKELVKITDKIYEENKKNNWLKIASTFSDVILEFERYCRIWGEVKQKNLQLSQARLSLIALSQRYLQWIIEQKLNAIANNDM